jgi:hypothetical protein
MNLRTQSVPHKFFASFIFLPTLAFALFLALAICTPILRSQSPLDEIHMECTAVAFAQDGRLAFATRHVYTLRSFTVQRDDLWIREKDGRLRKIVNGEKLIQGPSASDAFSYTINRLRWAPDGQRLTAELLTSQLTSTGGTQDQHRLLLLAQDGKEIQAFGGGSVIDNALDGTWLSDNLTICYLAQSTKSALMYSVGTAHTGSRRGGVLFEGRPFSAISWNAQKDSALAIDLGSNVAGPPQLVLLDLVREDHKPLVTLQNFHGGLTFSPSGTKAAYFIANDALEVREIAHPNLVARAHAPFGSIAWTPDESRLLVKSGLEREDGQLFWVALPRVSAELDAPFPAAPANPELGGIKVREFALSPDGHTVAIILPGSRHAELFELK